MFFREVRWKGFWDIPISPLFINFDPEACGLSPTNYQKWFPLCLNFRIQEHSTYRSPLHYPENSLMCSFHKNPRKTKLPKYIGMKGKPDWNHLSRIWIVIYLYLQLFSGPTLTSKPYRCSFDLWYLISASLAIDVSQYQPIGESAFHYPMSFDFPDFQSVIRSGSLIWILIRPSTLNHVIMIALIRRPVLILF